MLHPMFSKYTYFNDLISDFERDRKSCIYFESIKFIFPESPIIDVDYPNNKQYNVNSWYNYYSCYDGIDKIDKIDQTQYNNQSIRITKIINREAKILNNYKKIFLGGVSQGGTLIFDILNRIPKDLGGIFCIKSIYMDKYINLVNNLKTPIYIFSGENDNIYTISLQNTGFNILIKKKYNVTWSVIPNLDHGTKSIEENNFIINKFIENI